MEIKHFKWNQIEDILVQNSLLAEKKTCVFGSYADFINNLVLETATFFNWHDTKQRIL